MRYKKFTHNHLRHILGHGVVSFFPRLIQGEINASIAIYVRTYGFHSAGIIDDRSTCHGLLVNLVGIINAPQYFLVLRIKKIYSFRTTKGIDQPWLLPLEWSPPHCSFRLLCLVALTLIFHRTTSSSEHTRKRVSCLAGDAQDMNES